MMNTAQHAGKILDAWRVTDMPSFETALENVILSCAATRPICRYENECQEVLQSIAEHLLCLGKTGAVPPYSEGSGALILLSHLSWKTAQKTPLTRSKATHKRKKLNFSANCSKC